VSGKIEQKLGSETQRQARTGAHLHEAPLVAVLSQALRIQKVKLNNLRSGERQVVCEMRGWSGWLEAGLNRLCL